MGLDSELLFALAEVEKYKEYKLWFQIVANLYKQNPKEALKYVRALRRELMQVYNSKNKNTTQFREADTLLRATYILTAKDGFEDFMIAMEYDRARNARFWLPRRKQLEGSLKICSTIEHFMNDKNSKMLTLSLPPATGKSTLIKFLLAYIAGKFPLSCNMYISYSKGMVDVMYSSVLSMMTDREYNFKEIFPNLPQLKTSAEYSTLSFKGEPPTLGMVAIGGSVTGRTRANNFFITDDLVKNAEMARSPERLETLYQDYSATLKTRKIGDECKEIMLGTLWSLHDPISREKEKNENKKGYIFINYPVCDDNGHSNFDYKHPDRYSDEMVAQLRADLEPYIFSALYMGRPMEKEGMAFSPDELKYYSGILPDGEPDNIFFVADVAWGGGDSFSMPICYQYGDKYFIHDVLFDKGDSKKTKPRVIGKILKHKVMMGQFEANAGGNEYCDEIQRTLKKDYNYICSLTSKHAPTTQGKLKKIEQYQSEIREFYFLTEEARKGNDDYTRFMNELYTFSFIGKNLHDDAADSLAQLASYVFGKKQRATLEIFDRYGGGRFF